MASNKQTIYFKNILQKDVKLNIVNIGTNLNSIIKDTLASTYEGKCLKEGYIKNNSIVIINYSNGVLETDYVIFSVSFECLICRPIEGMKIKCNVDNVTKLTKKIKYDSYTWRFSKIISQFTDFKKSFFFTLFLSLIL